MDSHECVPPEVKKCSKCGLEKLIDRFGLSRGKRKAECKECFAEYHRAYYEKNRDKVLERTTRYKLENPDKVKGMMADWYRRNKDHALRRIAEYRKSPDVQEREKARQKAYYEARKEQIQADRKAKLLGDSERLERYREYQKEHYLNNKHLYIARGAKRRSKVEQATPAWANLDAIKAMYLLAQELERLTGQKYHVDHVLPLHGKNVCGFHVAENLQVMPAKANLSKSNKFEAG